MNKTVICLVFTAVVVIIHSCTPAKQEDNSNVVAKLELKLDSLNKRVRELEKIGKPAIGSLMLAIQAHHIKLGLAIKAGNWQLSDFELQEIEENFIELGQLYPTFENFNSPTDEYVKIYIAPAIEQLEDACKKEEKDNMNKAYNLLTSGCNSCHRETKNASNVIVNPTQSSFPDQNFDNIAE